MKLIAHCFGCGKDLLESEDGSHWYRNSPDQPINEEWTCFPHSWVPVDGTGCMPRNETG